MTTAEQVPGTSNRRAVGILTVGHVFNDLNQGVVPAMLPFLVIERDLSYTAAGGLLMAATVLSSVTQPVFGWVADSRSAAWLMPAGLFTAGLGIALAGVAPTYPWLVAAILLSGLGVAAFHPESARSANHASGPRTATGMSVFAVGGNIGYAAGPLLATPLLVAFGVGGTVLLILPAAMMAMVLVVNLPRISSPPTLVVAEPDPEDDPVRQDWAAFIRLTGVIILRSIAFYSLVTFIPLYWVEILEASPALGNASLTLMLGAGIAGTLVGGWLADRSEARRVIIAGLGSTAALLAALLATGVAGITATVLLLLIGFALYTPFGVMMSLGQAYLWRRVGTASGVTIGLSMTIGGLFAPLLGALADRQGLQAALIWVTAIPVLAALLACTLPAQPRVRRSPT